MIAKEKEDERRAEAKQLLALREWGGGKAGANNPESDEAYDPSSGGWASMEDRSDRRRWEDR